MALITVLQNQAEGITHDGTYLWVGNGGITFLPLQQLNKPIRLKHI